MAFAIFFCIFLFWLQMTFFPLVLLTFVAILFFYIQVWNCDFVLLFPGLYLVPFGLYVGCHVLKAFTFVFGFYVYCIGLKNWKKAWPLSNFDFDLVWLYIALDWKQTWRLSDSHFVVYCLFCLLYGFAFLLVLPIYSLTF